MLQIGALPNLIVEDICDIKKDETVTISDQVFGSETDDHHHGDLDYNTNKDETATVNGQTLALDTNDCNEDDHRHRGDDLDEDISTFNVSFSMPTKSLADNMLLDCDTPEIANIQLEMND